MSATVDFPDDAAHQDNLLMAEVGKLNEQLGRYLLRFLDADSRRATHISTADERALADRVAALAEAIQARADRRNEHGYPTPLIGPSSTNDERP
jgi:hypothetical protein